MAPSLTMVLMISPMIAMILMKILLPKLGVRHRPPYPYVRTVPTFISVSIDRYNEEGEVEEGIDVTIDKVGNAAAGRSAY